MFGNNKFDEMKRIQAGIFNNPMENSAQGFRERVSQGPEIGRKFDQAMNGNGPYQNITENTVTGFQQRQQNLNDKFQQDFKPLIPELKPIKNEFKLDMRKIDPLPKHYPPKIGVDQFPKSEPQFDFYDSTKHIKKPWEIF